MSNQVKEQSVNARPRKASGGRTIMTAILMVPVIAVLFPTCIVLAIGMLPSVVAYIVDRTGGKYLTITVALMNFCGTLPGITRLWQFGQAYDAAGRIGLDPLHWLASYGAAAVGWVIYLSIPPILSVFYGRVTQTRIEGLKRKQADLVEVWGPEVTGADGRKDSRG